MKEALLLAANLEATDSCVCCIYSLTYGRVTFALSPLWLMALHS